MTRRVVYSPRAERHLKGIYEWIATASSPETAERYVLSIFDHCDRLADFPMVGVLPMTTSGPVSEPSDFAGAP